MEDTVASAVSATVKAMGFQSPTTVPSPSIVQRIEDKKERNRAFCGKSVKFGTHLY